MKILKIHAPIDGFCMMECDFTKEEINLFVEYAVNDMLRKQIEKIKQETCLDHKEVIDQDTIEKLR